MYELPERLYTAKHKKIHSKFLPKTYTKIFNPIESTPQASRTLVLESKRFYLDVKENSRGRFIKIAEISADGRKNQILMTLPTAAQFRQHLVSMIQAVRWVHMSCLGNI